MKTTVSIHNKDVHFERNWFTGTFTYSFDGETKSLESALNPATHFSVELSRTYEATIGDARVTIIKTRPVLFAGFRAHNYKFYLNNTLIKEVDAL